MVTAIQKLNPIKSSLWLKCDELHSSSGVTKTYNYGRAGGIGGGIEHEITAGNGTATTTFPRLATPKGFEFTDGYYLSPNLDLGTAWSISFHVNYNGGNNEYIVGFSTGGGILINDNAATGYLTYYDETNRVSSGATLGRNRPYHVCVTKSAANSVKIYIDGTLKVTGAGTVSNTILTRIGCNKDGVFSYHGVLLNFEAFKYELDATQVTALKNRLSRESITAISDIFTPAALAPSLWLGAYEEARATRATQQAITDGDMEAVGTVGWAGLFGGTVLSKEAGARTGGTGAQVIRVTNANAGSAGQNKAWTVGLREKHSVWARVDAGAVVAKITDQNGTTLVSSTATTAWSLLSGDMTAAGVGWRDLQKAAGGAWIEFDDWSMEVLSLTSYLPRIGAALTQAGPTAMPWRGQYGIQFKDGDILQGGVAASVAKCLHDGTGGTLIVCVRPSVVNAVNYYANTAISSHANHGVGLWFDNANKIGVVVMNGGADYDLLTTAAANVSAGNTYVFTLRIAAGANGVTIRQNGVGKLTAALTAPSAADPSQGLQFGAMEAGNAACTDGAIPDALLVPRVLTDAECLQAERYMYFNATGTVAPW